jgi:hypothetical protein
VLSLVGLDTRRVFVQHSVHIDRPIETVSSVLAKDPRKWFPRLQSLGRTAVGPRVAGLGLLKKVAVKVGKPVTAGNWTEVPIRWQATSIKLLFPVMVGKVELAPVDGRVTRLTVSGMYQPPLGRLGEQLDDAIMHKVAEATVKELAESIAKRLDGAIPLTR